MTSDQYMQLGGIFVVAMGILRILEHTIKYAFEQRALRNGGGNNKTERMMETVQSIARGVDGLVQAQNKMMEVLTVVAKENHILFKQHDQMDEDGRPVWWNTRESTRRQERMAELLEKISTTQHNLFLIMSEMNGKIGSYSGKPTTNPNIRTSAISEES